MNHGLVYLASPYTPTAGESIEERVTAACRAAAELMSEGYAVFAPIPHSHAIAAHLSLVSQLQFDHEFWMRQDIAVLKHCTKLVVLMLPGFEKSKGVAREVQVARALGLPVEWRAVTEVTEL